MKEVFPSLETHLLQYRPLDDQSLEDTNDDDLFLLSYEPPPTGEIRHLM